MPPAQRIIATRVKQKCICRGRLEAFITAAGDHWHCSRIWQVCLRAPDFQKVGQHTGGKWLIQGTHHRKDNQSRSLELPCKISYMGTLIWQTIATCSVQYSVQYSKNGPNANQIFKDLCGLRLRPEYICLCSSKRYVMFDTRVKCNIRSSMLHLANHIFLAFQSKSGIACIHVDTIRPNNYEAIN